jgi:uncharacterized membrane protein
MAEPDGVIIYLGAYEDREQAVADFRGISALRHEKFIGDFEAAVFRKDDKGNVHIIDTAATERAFGAKVGAATGAVIGLVFPPSILAGAAIGAGAGALIGNFMRGLKRSDVKEIGELLDEGECGVVLVGFTTLEAGMERYMKNAAKVMKQEVDIAADDLKDAIDEAVENG